MCNVYQLVRKIQQGEPFPTSERSHGITQNNCNYHTYLLVSLLDSQRILQLAKQYSCAQQNCRHALRRLAKHDSKIERLMQFAGRGAEDAYLQLEELHAIGRHIKPMNHHCVRYLDPMMQNIHCHIRALGNLSQEAAYQALQQGIKHT